MGLTHSSDMEALELASTSSSEVESTNDEEWEPLFANEDEEEEDDEDNEALEERLRILQDARKLRCMAEFFLHPEKPLPLSQPCSRCYFDRASAPQQDDDEEEEQRAQMLADLCLLKKAAQNYLHPEVPLDTNPTDFARCYFDRPGAPLQTSGEEEEQRNLILQDAAALKFLAKHYMHPELPLETTPTDFAHCYFFAPAHGPEHEEERQHILEDCKALKKVAIQFLHPENPLPLSQHCPRCYFDRASAPQQDLEENQQQRAQILADVCLLKQTAHTYLHPEEQLDTSPTGFARCYFDRPSASSQTAAEDEEQRNLILQDAAALKLYAKHYLHPELPLETSPIDFAHCYFSAPDLDQEDKERQHILDDCKALKKLAIQFLHPEEQLEASDCTRFGRNWFTTPAAADQEQDEEERQQILQEARALEMLAHTHLHPELPLQIDPSSCGRNYFRVLDYVKDIKDRAIGFLGREEKEEDLHVHHAHFDMDDDIHLHHAEFDRNTDHHDEITELRHVTTPTTTRNVIDVFDHKLSSSPGCVMTFAHPKELDLPQMMERD